MTVKNTSYIVQLYLKLTKCIKCRYYKKKRNTIFHPDVLVWVCVPELFILVRVAHEGKEDLLGDPGHVNFKMFPRYSMAHAERERNRL